MLAQKSRIVPILANTTLHRLAENLREPTVSLSPDDLRELDAISSKIPAQGRSVYRRTATNGRPLKVEVQEKSI